MSDLDGLTMADDCGDTIRFEVTGESVRIVFDIEGERASMELGPVKQEEFAQLLVSATWEAKANREQQMLAELRQQAAR